VNGRADLPPLALLTALPLILYAPFLFGGRVLAWGVYLLQFLPWRQLAVDQIRAGHWPLWNPYLGAGTPLAANLQTAAFYPPNVLFLLMPVEWAFGWSLALHVALAGVFAYGLGRTLGLSRLGALVTGLAYGGGGCMVAHWVFPSMACAIVWPPLMLALTERLVQGGTGLADRMRRMAWLALVVALQLLAGHAQTSFYSLLIVAAYALFRSAQDLPPNAQDLGRARTSRVTCYASRVTLTALALVLGLALAAVQLLPTAELALHSQRAGAVLADEQFAFELSFWPPRLLSLAAPDLFGHPARGEYWGYGTYWEEAAYVGVLPLLLAVGATLAWWRRRTRHRDAPLALVPFLSLLALLSLVLALGDHTPLYPLLFRHVPGFGLFQAPARLMLGYGLAIAILAGIGVDMLRPTPRTRRTLRLVLVAGVGLGIGGGIAWLVAPGRYPTFSAGLARLGLLLALSAGVLLARPLAPNLLRRGRVWHAGLVALLLADLLWFGVGLTPGVDAAALDVPSGTAAFLQAQPPGRVFVAPKYADEVYQQVVNLRTFGTNGADDVRRVLESLHPNLNALYGLPGVANYDPLQVGRIADLWERLSREHVTYPAAEARQPLLDLLGVRYVFEDSELPLPAIYTQGTRIYVNDYALPEAFLVPRARVIGDADARLKALLEPGFDPRAEVLLEQSPPGPASVQPTANPAVQPEITILRDGPNRVTIGVRGAQGGYLVLTDTDYPGWRATVDGHPAEILRADHAFRAVALDAGDHTVTFDYRPASFRWGAWVTLGTALGLVGTVGPMQVLARRREHQRVNGV
jgi:hypothetical protein